VSKRNQEKRRAKKKQRDARQRATAGPQPGLDDSWGDFALREPFDGGARPSGDRPGARRPSLSEMADRILLDAAEGSEVTLSSAVAALTEVRLHGADGEAAVSRAVLALAGRILSSCWKGGWQPADIVRVVGRGFAARHVRLTVDFIAAEGRQYAAASLDARWVAQLQELQVAAWWGEDAGYLVLAEERENLDEIGMVTCALETLRLLIRLPRIESVGPPPGTAGPARQRTGAEPRALGRIRALLAKAESTEFAEEADAFTAKAQELMAQHSISVALLDADAGRDDVPAARRIGIDNPYEAPKALLLDAVTQANRCRSVWSKHLGHSTVVGFESDLDSVELLYTSLLVQATAAMNAAGSRRDRHGRSRTRAFRQSFLVAYANRIRQRLTEATEAAVQEAATGVHADGLDTPADPRLLPVLAARSDAVDDAIEQMFPGQVTHALHGTDDEGWAHGTAAADRAELRARTQVATGD
jgi:hypothetical protein